MPFWYPGEPANDRESPRNEFGRLIEETPGRKVERRLTTDYVIAIASVTGESADSAAVFGAVGLIEAHQRNPAVDVLFVNLSTSGILDDAVYYTWLCVNKSEENIRSIVTPKHQPYIITTFTEYLCRYNPRSA